MRLFDLDKGIYTYYRSHVHGNKYTSYEIARRKLTRNVWLGRKIQGTIGLNTYMYGNLLIVVDPKRHCITGLENIKGNYHFKRNEVLYKFLNWLLKID